MRVLLTGATGNVGSRLLPALRAHNHTVILYLRNPSKLPKEATALAQAIETGSGTDRAAIKSAILKHDCDAVINAAGLASMWSNTGELPTIFAAVTHAALAAREQRGGKPVRVWFMSGQGILDSPRRPYLMADYLPLFPIHRKNWALIQTIPTTELAWSLFCASQMDPRASTIDYAPQAGAGASNLVAGADAPPAWSRKLQWVPLLGTYLNIMAQAPDYFAPLEDCVDFLAGDLVAGLESEFVGKRVGVKVRGKSV
ncbi:hypothetical protein LTR53_007693 [Teratosphaeriaceae sp. CCFEE 6253]|nr:hypothetical protein LTR53_007693 [Teratosphaeriaceae sp. CCFEE 6253]